MYIKFTKTIGIFLLVSIFISASAQENDTNGLQGYIPKYDENFEGIGPEVYLLPAPRSKEELLRDAYLQKVKFTDSIKNALEFQGILNDYRSFNDLPQMRNLLSDSTSWEALLNNVNIQQNPSLYSQLLVEYAKISLNDKNISNALQLLHNALSQSQKSGDLSIMQDIKFNLSSLYLFKGQLDQANFFQQDIYKEAIEKKSQIDQAYALVKKGLIEAHENNYTSAEQTIIRKAIPLFNRSKAYEGKIWAWENLAKIYQMQNRHAEAQWFLLQARDLAKKHGFSNELAEIEYMLAVSKLIQKNYNIAQKEFLNAQKLAKEENNKMLELAIADKLGDIYMILEKYEEAQSYLDDYWDLRSQLF